MTEPQTESLEDIVKKFLDEYRDDENTYFPEDLWSLDNELKALIESEKAKSRREGKEVKTDKVTRFEVIDHTLPIQHGGGRVLVKYDVKVELSLQDDERTLKVFLT